MTGRPLLQMPFALPDLPRLRLRVQDAAASAGLTQDQNEDLTTAAYELACNAILHAGGAGNLQLTRAGRTLQCRVTDHGPGIPDTARPAPGGLSLARELTHDIDIDTGPGGTAVTVTMQCLPIARTPG